MDSFIVAGIVFACTFCGALIGMALRRILPDSHLSTDSKDVVKMGTGLLATLSALVLGLMVASAKSSYDSQKAGFQQLSTNLILLDRSLAFYGPEAKDSRELLRRAVTLVLNSRWPENGAVSLKLDSPEISEASTAFYASVRDLAPKTEAQKSIQASALQMSADLARLRWQLNQTDESSFPTPFLVVLVFWLTVLFITFGLFSPKNATVTVILFICALSLGGAVLLIVELDRPFHGVIQISSRPLRDALAQLGH
jgi:hypothetical protein